MRGRTVLSTFLRDGRVLFTLTVLVPGLLLGVVGARAFMQEQRFGAQWARDVLTGAARAAARDIQADLREWDDTLNHIQPDRDDFAAVRSSVVGPALIEPGAGLLIIHDEARLRIWPEQQLL